MPELPPPAMSMGSPPVGSSPATSPVPNKGLEAAGMVQLGIVVRQLEKLVPLIGAGTEAGKDVLQALTKLSKHVPPGAVSPGAEQTGMQNMLMALRQKLPQIAAMKQMMAQRQAQDGGGGAPMAGPASPSPPMGGAPDESQAA